MDAILSQKITAQGKHIETVQIQLESFKEGFPFLSLVAPATPTRGIQVWSESQVKDYQSYFEKRASDLELVKFVPASGAASRMFKDLFSFFISYKAPYLSNKDMIQYSPFIGCINTDKPLEIMQMIIALIRKLLFNFY